MSADRILTTHAGSLPRPDDLVDMIWAQQEGSDVDQAELEDASTPPSPRSWPSSARPASTSSATAR